MIDKNTNVEPEIAGSENQSEPTLYQLLLDDLNGEVKSVSTEEPQEEEGEGASDIKEGENQLPVPKGTPANKEDQTIPEGFVAEEKKNLATLEDLEGAKRDILSQILDVARKDTEGKQGVGNSEESTEVIPEEFDEEEFLDNFSTNPMKTILELTDKRATEKAKAQFEALATKLKPLIQQSEILEQKERIKNIYNKLVTENDDAKDLFPKIADYIKSNRLDLNDERSYVDGYRVNKIQELKELVETLKSQARSLDEHAEDEESIKKLLSNPKLQERFIAQYLEDIDSGRKPATISSGGGVNPLGEGRKQFKSINDAGEAFRQSL